MDNLELSAEDKACLLALADWCERYGAGIRYTRDDDGVHIQRRLTTSTDKAETRDIYVGFLDTWLDSDVAQTLRVAAA